MRAAVVPLQCLGELFRLFTGKAGRSVPQAGGPARLDLCVAHRLASWDALVHNVAAEGGARLLLTENVIPQFSWRGVQVVNPLKQPAAHA